MTTEGGEYHEYEGRLRSLVIIVLAEVMALGLWFSATAILPVLRANGEVSDLTGSLFTSAVQAGFVGGTLLFAVFGVADRLDPRRVFALCAIVGAIANLGLLFVALDGWQMVTLRFLTGAIMAGVYPVGMKLAVGWAREDVGLLVGLLVGALTLGSGSPHVFVFSGGTDWQQVLVLASVMAGLSAPLILMAKEGPSARRAAAFRTGDILVWWTNKPVRLANFGYLGHMWELYAMWAWIGTFLLFAFQHSTEIADPQGSAALVTFLVVAAGGPGAIMAGWAADKAGRTAVTSICMAVSGSCALLIGFLIDAPVSLLIAVALVWGFSIVADSAQFSASVSELSPPELVGTMLTLQTCAGFLLTLLTIHLVPVFVRHLGWELAFAPLAIGPALGILAMLRLRRMPEARNLSGGNR